MSRDDDCNCGKSKRTRNKILIKLFQVRNRKSAEKAVFAVEETQRGKQMKMNEATEYSEKESKRETEIDRGAERQTDRQTDI